MSHQEKAGTNEERLLRRVTLRDHTAFAELYDQVAGLLFSNAVHILADRREAEEVVQDVFLQIWNKAGAFDSELGSPLSWMLGITRNRCIDRLRSRQRRARVFDLAKVHPLRRAALFTRGGGPRRLVVSRTHRVLKLVSALWEQRAGYRIPMR